MRLKICLTRVAYSVSWPHYIIHNTENAANGSLFLFSDIYFCRIYILFCSISQGNRNVVNSYSQETLPAGAALINNLKMGW